MWRLSIDPRKIVLVVIILSPPFIGLMPALAMWAHTGTDAFVWPHLSMGLFGSLVIGTACRRPLIDPDSRWGVLGRRHPQRPRLWMFLVFVAAFCPWLACIARIEREHREFNRSSATRMEARLGEQIARFGGIEKSDLDKAREFERRAAECREMEARGEPPEPGANWSESAAELEKSAAHHRRMAELSRKHIGWLMEQRERSRRP